MIVDYYFTAIKEHAFDQKRAKQNIEWMRRLMHEMLDLKLSQNPRVKDIIPELERQVTDGRTTPYAAAEQILSLL